MTELQLEFIRKFSPNKNIGNGCLVVIEKDDSLQQYVIGDDLYSNTETTLPVSFDNNSIHFEANFGDSGSSYFDVNIVDIIGYPYVQWHDVFARLKENGYRVKTYSNQGDYIYNIYGIIGKNLENYEIIINPCESPMEQPALIEQLLLLSN